MKKILIGLLALASFSCLASQHYQVGLRFKLAKSSIDGINKISSIKGKLRWSKYGGYCDLKLRDHTFPCRVKKRYQYSQAEFSLSESTTREILSIMGLKESVFMFETFIRKELDITVRKYDFPVNRGIFPTFDRSLDNRATYHLKIKQTRRPRKIRR